MTKKLIWLAVYAAAMAYIESAVVVYLRELYYPEGFTFPVQHTPIKIALVEIGREAATLVMLFSIAWVVFKKGMLRFCAFMLMFGVWDLFYYFWLYVILAWPPSLFTWDVLFLIPLPWIGPILAPMIVSISLIISAVTVVALEERWGSFHPSAWQWAAAIAAGLIIISSFMIDYRIVLNGAMPGRFKWEIFTLGLVMGLAVFLHALLRFRKNRT